MFDENVIEAFRRRALRDELEPFIDQAKRCGWCAAPLRLRGIKYAVSDSGTKRLVFTSSSKPDGVVLKACENRRETRCSSCARIYRSDARHIVKAGLEGGKGVPETVASHPAVFLTLTAPSFGTVHRSRGAVCNYGDPKARCAHGKPTACYSHHQDDDKVLGTPLCPTCYDYESQVLYNASVPELWRRTSVYIPRHLARLMGITQDRFNDHYRVSFARVAEFQRRGAVHLHVVVRLDRKDETIPDVSPTLVAVACRSGAMAVSITDEKGSRTWGEQLDAEVLDRSDSTRAGRLASYVAKYAVKSSHSSGSLDRKVISDADIERRKLPDHPRRLVSCAWRLARAEAFAHLHLARSAHCYGYGGHFLGKSRHYSTTFGALRQARAIWQQERSPIRELCKDVVSFESRWRLVGIGWATKAEALCAKQFRR